METRPGAELRGQSRSECRGGAPRGERAEPKARCRIPNGAAGRKTRLSALCLPSFSFVRDFALATRGSAASARSGRCRVFAARVPRGRIERRARNEKEISRAQDVSAMEAAVVPGAKCLGDAGEMRCPWRLEDV